MKRIVYLILTALAMSGAACSTDEEARPEEQLPPVPAGHVRMQITVPGLSNPDTYALAPVDECKVEEVDVLVFGADNKFLCHAQGEDIADAPDALNGNKKTFIVDLSDAGNLTVQVTVVANAHNIVATAVGNTIIPNSTTATDAMTKLEFACNGKWNVTKATSEDFKPFPMWGMATADLSDMEQIQSISLMRAVAKIDVGVNFTGETATGLGQTLVMDEIRLYNLLGKGSVAPYNGKYAGTTATAVSIPTTAVVNTTNPLVYQKATASDGFNANGLSCMNAIYMAEHAAGTAGGQDNACLVIGGKYNGDTFTTWYRIDFVTAGGAYLPVLRNHRYKVNIKSVGGRGYSSVSEALTGESLDVEITVENEALTSHAYNGQYALSVSTDAFTFSGSPAGVTGYIDLFTSFSGGYTATVTTGGDWLEITSGGQKGTATAPAPATLDRINIRTKAANTGANRSGTITVTSGALTREITVTQPSPASAKTFTVAEQQTFPNDGRQQTLAVTSNCDWCVSVDYRWGGIVKSYDASGSGNGNFKFTLIDNDPVAVYGTPFAIFTFYSPTGEFEPVKRTVKLPATTAEYHPATHGGWAGCNIYWDGSKLTFDNVGETAHQNYQGVFFKWGSLWGLDPSYGNDYEYWNNNIAYVSDPSAGWSVNNTCSWNSIPYNDANDWSYDYSWSCLYEEHNPLAGKGDICRYITEINGGALHGKKWRMPIKAEFEGNYTKSAEYLDYLVIENSPAGTYPVTSGYTKTGDNVFFPATGYRSENDGYLDFGLLYSFSGVYWMSSPTESPYVAGYMLFNGYGYGYIYGGYGINKNFALSVRCVAEQ